MTAHRPRAATWRLRALLEGIAPVPERADTVISGLRADSRAIRRGDLFFARPGLRTDGARYIEAAIEGGAAAVVRAGERDGCTWRGSVPVVTTTDLQRRMGAISDRWYGRPSRSMRVVGVTGTNGKTSVSHLVAQVLHATPEFAPGAVIGTLGYGAYGALAASSHTTPDVITTHCILAGLARRGVRHAVMEVSSHGLEQGRVEGVEFDVAVFTNLTRDHLDYHGDQSAYARAKRRLWQDFAPRAAVLNVDDPFGRTLLDALPAGVEAITFGMQPDPPGRTPGMVVRAEPIAVTRDGLGLRIRAPGAETELRSRLLGRFNAENLVAALATLLALGVPLDRAVAGLSAAPPLPGRMQVIPPPGRGGPLLVVDYAHTPDALACALAALRELTSGELWCVFGCGGDRDRGKRALMGEIAARAADHVIVTNDNPRTEAPDRIIADILTGVPQPRRIAVEPDRGAAIRRAVGAAGGADAVLIAGKGHETYQEEEGIRRPFDDAAAAGAAVEARGP